MPPSEPVWEELSSSRAALARRLEAGAGAVAAFTLEAGAGATELLTFCRQLAAVIEERAGTRLSVTHVLVAAAGRALASHPALNVRYEERDGVPGLVRPGGTSVGLAVAAGAGLVVPAIRDVAERPLPEVVVDVERAVAAARTGAFAGEPEAALTVSNLGRGRVRRLQAAVTPPESCVLGAGAVQGDPPALSLSLSCDPRAVDAQAAARFLTELVELVERPYRLLL